MVWFAAILIGFSLGVLGSGGSILTVPALIYLVGQNEKTAIASSLIIVGFIAASSAVNYLIKRQIKWYVVFRFGLPSMIASYLAAGLSVYLSGVMQLMLFSIVMLLSAFFMVKQKVITNTSLNNEINDQQLQLIFNGIFVGCITGLVGVGGGFLIVPSLVLLLGLPMINAIATSLVIITLQSFAGFIKYHQILAEQNITLPWRIIIAFCVLGVAGSFIGQKFAASLPEHYLKRGFGVVLLIMGSFILIHSILQLG